VLAGCLRNAAAVAGWLAGELAAGRLAAVAVIAAGERWPDGSLRPAVEDLWGAGAVLHRLGRLAPELPASPEARAAAAAFAAAEPDLRQHLRECASGVELIEDGFDEDVAIAAELDADRAAPLLDRGRFRPA
jgi:2-phosphosulfolactate phosphatase